MTSIEIHILNVVL